MQGSGGGPGLGRRVVVGDPEESFVKTAEGACPESNIYGPFIFWFWNPCRVCGAKITSLNTINLIGKQSQSSTLSPKLPILPQFPFHVPFLFHLILHCRW